MEEEEKAESTSHFGDGRWRRGGGKGTRGVGRIKFTFQPLAV